MPFKNSRTKILSVECGQTPEWRVDGYLASRGGSVGTETYRVKTGDSAWGIARNQGGIPVWLLGDLNPSVNLERLRPGMELELPVLADVVVDAE